MTPLTFVYLVHASVNEAPVPPSFSITALAPHNAAPGRIIYYKGLVDDPEGGSLRFDFISGNEDGTWAVEGLPAQGMDIYPVPANRIYRLVIYVADTPTYNKGIYQLTLRIEDDGVPAPIRQTLVNVTIFMRYSSSLRPWSTDVCHHEHLCNVLFQGSEEAAATSFLVSLWRMRGEPILKPLLPEDEIPEDVTPPLSYQPLREYTNGEFVNTIGVFRRFVSQPQLMFTEDILFAEHLDPSLFNQDQTSPQDGSHIWFRWFVPLDLAEGRYFIRVRSPADPGPVGSSSDSELFTLAHPFDYSPMPWSSCNLSYSIYTEPLSKYEFDGPDRVSTPLAVMLMWKLSVDSSSCCSFFCYFSSFYPPLSPPPSAPPPPPPLPLSPPPPLPLSPPLCPILRLNAVAAGVSASFVAMMYGAS